MTKNRFLNAESLALARIWPAFAAFPVRRVYEVKKIRKRKMQQPYSRFTPAARMKSALIYEGGLAAVRTYVLCFDGGLRGPTLRVHRRAPSFGRRYPPRMRTLWPLAAGGRA